MKTKSLIAKRLAVLAIAVGFLATFVPQASAGQPCCNITKIDTRTGVVTAQDTTTGHTFQFTASPARPEEHKAEHQSREYFVCHQLLDNNDQPCCAIIPP